MATKEELKERREKQVVFTEAVLDISNLHKCCKPCFIFQDKIENSVGGKHNPFHWIVNVGGYALINVIVQIRGTKGKHYQVQLRHHHPSANYGQTATFTFAKDVSELNNTGFALVTFNGIRPMMPDVDIILFSDDESDFDLVQATIYATIA